MAIVVIGQPFRKAGKINRYVRAKCECGKEFDTTWGARRRIISCGCKRPPPSRLKHGNCKKGSGKESGVYTSWRAMRERCSNPANKMWDRYGGRGIRVCERWDLFENFLADMGSRKKNETIERINIDGNYEPANCIWVSRSRQNNNKSNNKILCIYGKAMSLADWHNVVAGDTKYATIKARLKRGWCHKEAVFGRSKNGN